MRPFSLTATVTFLLVTAVQTVSVSITVPSERDAVAVFALVLVAVALHVTAVLRERRELCISATGDRRSGNKMRDTSSDPSAQSWSPSHFQRPAMQRPFAQANSLSEHWRGTGDRGGTVKETESRANRARWGRREEARRGVNGEKRKQGAERTASPRIIKADMSDHRSHSEDAGAGMEQSVKAGEASGIQKGKKKIHNTKWGQREAEAVDECGDTYL